MSSIICFVVTHKLGMERDIVIDIKEKQLAQRNIAKKTVNSKARRV